MNVPIITRTSEPNKLDTADFGTLCKVSNLNGTSYYIQLSNDVENPRWQFIDTSDEGTAQAKAIELLKC